ncbi:O-acyltransferase like protein-like [Tachypleus tridentatus]|uniref:O-acyltransferase like protein-like n=1 Tax=Tachypleus tridentatus TaxID=6853 RepID=UPI003FD2504A
MEAQKFENVPEALSKSINHLGCYCVGLLAGYALARKKLTNVSKIILALGWISSMFSFMSVIYGMYDWNRGIEGSTAVALMYAGLHRPVWAAAVAWLILMCVTGRGSVINTLLSWKPFISLDRLTYMVYLIHHVIVYVYNGYVRNLINTKEITIAYIMFGHILLSYLISAICVLLVESPFFAIRQKFLSRSRGRKLVTQTTNDEATGDTELVEKTIVRNGGACHS